MSSAKKLAERLTSVEKILRDTPVVRLEDDTVELYAKLEFLNGIGSIKDRPALWVLKGAIERGEVGPDTTIIESSSGNFALALAAFCRMLELDFIPVIDPNISALYEASLRSQCARVVKVEERDDSGGFLKTRLAAVRKLREEFPDSYWPNQYENVDAMHAHYHVTAEQIIRNAPPLDYVFLGVSTGGTLSGISQRLKEHQPSVKIIAVDAEGSVIFGHPPKKRWIPGLGSSITPPLVGRAIVDEVLIVPEVDTIAGCHELLDRHALFAGGSTGTSYSAIRRYFGTRPQHARPRVLFLCCDRGTPYLDTIYDARWAQWRATVDLPVREAELAHA